MPKLKNEALMVDKICVCCGHTFNDYASKTTKVCDKCLHSEHASTCLQCGKIMTYKGGSLIKFLNKDYCGDTCRHKASFNRGEMLLSIYSHLLEPRGYAYYQKADIVNLSESETNEIISEQCASIVLYQLYAELEPYYKECISGMTFNKYLPSTQQYLLDILHYIRVINKILRLDLDGKPVGKYADGRSVKRYQDQGNWETGPTDEDLKNITI